VNTYETGRRRRRRHSPEFKARVVAACRKRGVSIAAVALDHRLNANLVRRWVVAAERDEESAPVATKGGVPARVVPESMAFVPLPVSPPRAVTTQEIVIELRRGTTAVKVSWPVSAAAGCAAWLGELLR
jgi:transposase-like protein